MIGGNNGFGGSRRDFVTGQCVFRQSQKGFFEIVFHFLSPPNDRCFILVGSKPVCSAFEQSVYGFERRGYGSPVVGLFLGEQPLPHGIQFGGYGFDFGECVE